MTAVGPVGDGVRRMPDARADAPRASRTAWLLFAPPFAVTALHVVLTTLAERWPSAQPLVAARVGGEGTADADAAVHALIWQASWPVLLALVLVVAGALLTRVLLRRVGWARLAPVARVLWIGLWAALAAGLLLRHANGALLTTLPAASARVLEARPQPSSERGPGGALALLQLQGDSTIRRSSSNWKWSSATCWPVPWSAGC